MNLGQIIIHLMNVARFWGIHTTAPSGKSVTTMKIFLVYWVLLARLADPSVGTQNDLTQV